MSESAARRAEQASAALGRFPDADDEPDDAEEEAPAEVPAIRKALDLLYNGPLNGASSLPPWIRNRGEEAQPASE